MIISSQHAGSDFPSSSALASRASQREDGCPATSDGDDDEDNDAGADIAAALLDRIDCMDAGGECAAKCRQLLTAVFFIALTTWTQAVSGLPITGIATIVLDRIDRVDAW